MLFEETKRKFFSTELEPLLVLGSPIITFNNLCGCDTNLALRLRELSISLNKYKPKPVFKGISCIKNELRRVIYFFFIP